MHLAVVVPCYNEAGSVKRLEGTLLPVLASLRDRFARVELVAVDDGSRDGTGEALERLAAVAESVGVAGGDSSRVVVTVCRHARNAGLGAALRTGFAATTADVVVTTDADATYRFEEIPALLALLDTADVVTASPYHPAGGVEQVPAHRLVLSRGSSWIYRVIVGGHVHTWTALFRAYRRPVLDAVPFEASGFLAGTEILVGAVKRGFRVVEYPTILHARDIGSSKARVARIIGAHLAFQGRLLGDRFRLGAAAGGAAQ